MRTSTVFLATAAALVSRCATNAQITKMIASGSEQVCSQIIDLISPRDRTTCDCDGSFTMNNGLVVDVACQSSKTVCVGGDLFCGTPKVDATVTPRGIEQSQACLSFNLTEATVPDLCVSAQGVGFGRGTTATMDSCTVKVGDTACNCTVCDGGRDFTFDCSAIEIDTPSILLPTFPGPKSDRCIGLGLLPDIRGDGDGVFDPFGSSNDDSNSTAVVANTTAVNGTKA